MKEPLVSVVMPVRDGSRFISEALESILGQTLRDFELIVVDDGSTDGTPDIVGSYGDPRIRLLRQPPEGLVAALNRGVAEARGRYIARMDADDVSLPERLERQARFLDAHPELAFVAPSRTIIAEEGNELRRELLLTEHDDLGRCLLLRNPFSHGSVMIRKDALDEVGPYSDDYGHNEDYDLWRRLLRTHRLAALPDVLYRHRHHETAVTRADVSDRIADRERLRAELWEEFGRDRRGVGKIVQGGREYRARGRELFRSYLDDQWALARESLQRRRTLQGLRLAVAALLLQPGSALPRLRRAFVGLLRKPRQSPRR